MKANKDFTSTQLVNSLKKAIHKMLIKTALSDGEIVIEDENGNPIKIKAKKALKDWNK
jgi:hypothetical protein